MLIQRKISQFLGSAAPYAIKAGGLGVCAGLMAATPAHADTTVSTGTTGTYVTSTAGSVTIAGTGTLTGASGPVITVNSNNNATVNANGNLNAGTATAPSNGNIGVQINPGVTTTVTNAGTISVLENFTPQSIDGNLVKSPVSGVSGRYGIYGAAGGVINATISSTGAITVDGENSAGIQLDSALTGSINNQGAITVLGDNSFGVKLLSVTGNVTVGGTVTAIGSAAQGYVQSGAVSGAIVIDGAISNSFSYTDTSGTALMISKALFNTSTPVVEIDSNVAGGILINAPLTSTSTDSNRGSISALGNNPALQIGGATNITIGANTATNNGSYALGIDGSVTASSANFTGTPAYGVVIGGKGGNVTLTNGMEVYGSVSATTADTSATAILINAGSSVPVIFNTGTIKAIASSEASGSLTGILDLSGSVKSLTNQGFITVAGQTDGASAAINLSANTTGVTLTQAYTSTNASTEATDKTTTGYNAYTATEYAGITGNIMLGSGNNTIAIGSGTVNAPTTSFAAGGSNTITMADTTRWVGNIVYGAGGTQNITMGDYAQFNGNLALANDAGLLTINNQAIFLGAITGGANFNVAVNGTGIFGANTTGTSTINALTVAAGGNLRVFIDGTTETSSKLVANSVNFASGAKVSLTLNSLKTNGTFDVLTSATPIVGASALAIGLPVLFSGSVNTTANDVTINIAPASASQLGLTSAQGSAYNAIINDASANTNLQSTLLQIYDTPDLRGRMNELLPDYSGGTFDVVSRATRIANKHFDNDSTMFSISDSAAWLEPIVFSGTRAYGATPGFKDSGFGISTGIEKVTPVGNIGFQLAYLSGSVKTATYQHVKASEVDIGLFWRKSAGPLYLWAGGNLGREAFDSTRTFNGEFSTTTSNAVTVTNFAYHAAGHWAGWSGAATGGVSYTAPFGEHFSLRPRGFIEYDRLNENSYIESGDTPIALTVLARKNTQTTATTTLTGIWSVGPSSHEGRPFSVEIEAGRRTWLAGDVGTTTATFETGDTFSVSGGHLPSAWLGGLSIMQGGLDYTWRLGTDFERGSDKGVAYGVRASIAIAL
ncbi:autotransporter domain-containing protein [Novosphingobium sp.]|uniref:autotransporter domain-containing protein n=1 Tax=Novosphingobium sp. TaxID=1874826 RepID=UPI003B521104